MADSVHKDKFGPEFPLGLIVVAAAGTPVSIMSRVDPTGVNDPSSPSPGTVAADEYTVSFQQILFQAVKAGAGPPSLAVNTGNVYILRKGAAGGTGNATDKGTIIKMLIPGESYAYPPAPSAMGKNQFNGYRYFIDADTTADACLVTGIIA